MANPTDTLRQRAQTGHLNQLQIHRDQLKKGDAKLAVQYASQQCEVNQKRLAGEAKSGDFKAVSKLVPVGIPDRKVEPTPSAGWMNSITSLGGYLGVSTETTESTTLSPEDTKTVIDQRDEYYSRIHQLEARVKGLVDTIDSVSGSLDRDFQAHDEVLTRQTDVDFKKQQLLDELQRRNQRLFARYNANRTEGNFLQAMIDHLQGLEGAVDSKQGQIDGYKRQLQRVQREIEELSSLYERSKAAEKLSEQQMIQALTEQDRMTGVEGWASTLQSDLDAAKRRLVMFEDAFQGMRQENYDLHGKLEVEVQKLNQVSQQLKREQGAWESNLQLRQMYFTLQQQLREAERNFAAAMAELEPLRTVQADKSRADEILRRKNSELRQMKETLDSLKQDHSEAQRLTQEQSKEIQRLHHDKASSDQNLETLRKSVRELEAQIKVAERSQNKLRREKAQAKASVSQLKSDFTREVGGARFQADQANVMLKQQLDVKKGELDREIEKQKNIGKELTTLKQQVRESERRASEYFHKSQDLEQKVEGQGRTISQLTTESDRLKRSLASMERKEIDSNTQLRRLKTELDRASKELSALKSQSLELGGVKKSLESVQAELNLTQVQLHEVTEKEAGLKKSVERKDKELRELRATSRLWTSQKVGMETRVEQAEREKQRLQNTLDDGSKQIRASKLKVDSLEQQLASVQSQLSTTKGRLSAGQSANDKKVQVLSGQVAELQRQLRKAESEFKEAEGRFTAQYAAVNQRATELTQETVNLKVGLSSAQQAEKDAKAKLVTAQKDCRLLEERLGTMDGEKSGLTHQVVRLKEEHSQLSREKVELQSRVEAMTNELDALKPLVEKAQMLETQLKDANQQLSREQDHSRSREEELESQMETVREQLRDTQEREEHARFEMTKYQLEYAEVKASNTELQKLVDDISTHQTASGNDTGQEWTFEEDDGGAFMSLSSQSVYRGQSLHQPTLEAFDEEDSLTSLPTSKGVVRFELTQILEQKRQLEQDLSDLDDELCSVKGQVYNQKDENKRLTDKVREFTREIAELKSTARGHTHREIDLDDQRKKAESKVRNLELEMKTLKEDTEQEVLEARKFAEDTGRERNAALKENGHLKTRLEDAEHRLETELPALQQKNSDMMAVLMQVAGAFHQRFTEGDDHAFVQSQLQVLATYFSDPAK